MEDKIPLILGENLDIRQYACVFHLRLKKIFVLQNCAAPENELFYVRILPERKQY